MKNGDIIVPFQIVSTDRHAQLLNRGGRGTKIVKLVGGYKDCWEGGRAQTVKQFKVQKGDWDKVQENKLNQYFLRYIIVLKLETINSKRDYSSISYTFNIILTFIFPGTSMHSSFLWWQKTCRRARRRHNNLVKPSKEMMLIKIKPYPSLELLFSSNC